MTWRVHAGLDDLQGDHPAYRLLLLGHEDDAEAALADRLHHLVRADDRAGTFRHGRAWRGLITAKGPAVERAGTVGMGFQQQVHLAAQLLVPDAGFIQIGAPLLRRVLFYGSIEDSSEFFEVNGHGRHSSRGPS
jgi:hypothetical protein